jgi:uncharacterized protein
MINKEELDAAVIPQLTLAEKESRLRNAIRSMDSVVVAFSGGIDSTYLGYAATRELGKKAICVMGISPSVSSHQKNEAFQLASDLGFEFRTIQTNEMADPQYTANAPNRCYFCKDELYGNLRSIADAERVTGIIDGTNFDDLGDSRPGRKAAAEWGVTSPLAEAQLTKSEIRELSLAAGINGSDRPASPCLSSRIAHGVPVTIDRLSKVERGEDFLRALGFREFRVRVHGELARIEISKDEMDLALAPEMAERLSKHFLDIGFKYSTLDLGGFRSGSMNA